MRSNGIVFIGLVIFITIAVFGSYAGYETTFQVDPTGVPGGTAEVTPVSAWDIMLPWGSANPIGTFIREHVFRNIPIIGESTDSLTFLNDLLTFQVPGVPWPMAVALWVLLFMVVVAVARIVLGTLAGGAD